MNELPFNLELMQFIFDHRVAWMTPFIQFFSFMGEVEGYVLVVTFIYTTYDKHLAIRLAMVALLMMSLNHLLKTIIANPRPFVTEGTYAEKWAVSPSKVQELATEFSTPSGHAMSASAFYAYLYACVRNRWVRMLALVAILLTGLSRPYIGVHYVEDILIGWCLGIFILLATLRYSKEIAGRLANLPYKRRVIGAVGCSMALWLATFVMNGSDLAHHPLPFVGYLGFLTGIIASFPLEVSHVNFDPKSPGLAQKLARYCIMAGFVATPILALDYAFESVLSQTTYFAHFVQYVGYATAAFLGVFLAPLLFVRFGLATTVLRESENP